MLCQMRLEESFVQHCVRIREALHRCKYVVEPLGSFHIVSILCCDYVMSAEYVGHGLWRRARETMT